MWGRTIAGALAAWTLTAFLATGAMAQGAPMIMPMSEFQLEMRAALLKLDPTLRIELVGEDSLKVRQAKAKGQESLSLFLGNAYERYRKAPQDLEAIIGQWTRVVAPGVERAALEPKTLVVLIRPQDYLETAKAGELVSRPLVGDFIEILAIDEGESFRLATQEELKKADVGIADAWAAARRNTSEKIGPFRIDLFEPGIWLVTDDANLALNLVSMPERWAAQGIQIKDEAAVVFLQRNMLLLADASDPARLSLVRRFVKVSEGEPEVFSTTIFLYRHGNWSVLEPSK